MLPNYKHAMQAFGLLNTKLLPELCSDADNFRLIRKFSQP